FIVFCPSSLCPCSEYLEFKIIIFTLRGPVQRSVTINRSNYINLSFSDRKYPYGDLLNCERHQIGSIVSTGLCPHRRSRSFRYSGWPRPLSHLRERQSRTG